MERKSKTPREGESTGVCGSDQARPGPWGSGAGTLQVKHTHRPEAGMHDARAWSSLRTRGGRGSRHASSSHGGTLLANESCRAAPL